MSEVEAQKRLVTTRFRERLARMQIEAFKRNHSVGSDRGLSAIALVRLERLLNEAQVAAQAAQEDWDEAQRKQGRRPKPTPPQ
jgi:hypothetical protein